MSMLIGCTHRQNDAPVVEIGQFYAGKQVYHRVYPGETLYAIAFRYDRDYRKLAAFNRISPPYIVRIGQVIRIPDKKHAESRYVKKKLPFLNGSSHRPRPYLSSRSSLTNPSISWVWPAEGKVMTRFMPHLGKKGIDIAGKKGNGVRAAAAGEVAYAGNGLSGYGNLIIIKHDGQFLTAYGNNLRNYVKEGQKVKAGQIIAEIGIVDRKFWGVHFEIRKAGQPVNPLSYLQRHF